MFYLVVDAWPARAWCQSFVGMGTNAITVRFYMFCAALFALSSLLCGLDRPVRLLRTEFWW
jgi:hypothetical protein